MYDWSGTSIAGSSVPSPRGSGNRPQSNRPRQRHIVVDTRGIPLAVLISGANRHDSMMFEKCLDALPALKGLRG
ncbi:transposase [Ottowia thiooxydans]|uniref:Transposase IS4-like domain-containing protein n=1 Tax=Ottowia thiooxydans TaxID=219182 RepID=A0ABV2Q835_9BURK